MILRGTLIGRKCPFFIGNKDFGKSYLLYQVISPGLSPKCIPYIGLEKISERGKVEDDIISAVMGEPCNTRKSIEYTLGLLRRKENGDVEVSPGRWGIPYIELGDTTNPQRNLITGLRSGNRWANYSLTPGKMVDILWSPDKIVMCEIQSSQSGELKLNPTCLYEIDDMNLENPIKLPSRLGFPSETYKNASALNIAIKEIEWKSIGKAWGEIKGMK